MFRLLPSDWNLSPRAREIRDRVLVFVVFPLALALSAYILISEMTSRAQQRALVSEIQQTKSSSLESAKLFPGHNPYVVEPCLVVVDPIMLRVMADFFADADNTGYNGHQLPSFEFTMRLQFSDAQVKPYLIRAFRSHPADIFLDRDIHEIYGEGAFSRKGQRPVRIPRLLPWLREHAANAGCPGSS